MFDFLVSGLSREQAEKLLEIIKAFIEACKAEMTGGFVEAEDEDASTTS